MTGLPTCLPTCLACLPDCLLTTDYIRKIRYKDRLLYQPVLPNPALPHLATAMQIQYEQ